MPLEFSHVPIQIGGINTKMDDKQLQAGTFVSAENVVMQKTGKIQNRPGYKFTSTPITHSSEVIAAAAYDNGNISIERDGSVYFDELNATNKVGSWNNFATIEFEQAKWPVVLQSNTVQHYNMSTNSLYCSSVFMVKNATQYEMKYAIASINTNLILESNLNTSVILGTSATIAGPVAYNGDSVAYTYSGGSIGNIVFKKYATTAITYATGALEVRKMDVKETAAYIICLYQDSANNIILGIYTKVAATWNTITVAATTASVMIALNASESGNEIDVAYQNDTDDDYYVFIYNFSGTLIYNWSIPITDNRVKLAIGLNSSDATNIYIAAQNSSAAYNIAIHKVNKATGVIATTTNILGCELVSKISYPYVVVKNADIRANSTYFIADLSTTFVYAPLYNTLVASYGYGEAIIQSEFTASSLLLEMENLVFPYIRFNPTSGIGAADKSYGIFMGHMKGNITTNKAQVIPWNGSLITNAWGSLRTIDNAEAFQPLWTSMPLAAMIPTLSALPPHTSTALGAGTYTYVLVYQTYDINNNVIYSSPLQTASITFAAGTQNSVRVVNIAPQFNFLPLNATSTDSVIKIYRTEADGDLFYFVGEKLITTVFDDIVTDAVLIGNRSLYTTGGLIDSSPCPIAKNISLAKNRLWVITSESNELVYFSKKQFPKEAPQFNSYFVIKVQSLGGNLITCAEMDDKVIIFRQNAIYATYGEGPDESGTGSFADPQLITQSMGCKYAQSVVLTDAGLMFMSYEGIWLVTRGLQLQYIGAPLEAFNSLEITAALNLIDRHQVWFTSATGTTLVWDDQHGMWYTFINQPTYAPFLTNVGVPAHYRAIAASKYPGRLMIEDATKWYDGASDNPITVTLETGWIALSGVQNFQRLKKLTWLGKLNDTLTIKSYFNFETTLNETFTVTTTAAGTSPAQYQVLPKQQKSESMKWKFEIASLTGAFELSSLGIEAGIKRGTFKVNQSKRVQGV
jgi:hypothetical protein